MCPGIDKLPAELPSSKRIDSESASAVQELAGGRFGEMSTFDNYLAQSLANIYSGIRYVELNNRTTRRLAVELDIRSPYSHRT